MKPCILETPGQHPDRIQVAVEANGRLSRRVYQFWYSSSYNDRAIKLDDFAEQERETTRHKYRDTGASQLLTYWGRNRFANMGPIPVEVGEIVLAAYRDRITFDTATLARFESA